MFRFEHIEFLWALEVLPVFLLTYFLYKRSRRKLMDRWGDYELLKQHITEFSPIRVWLKLIFFSVAFIFLIIGLSNPQLGSKPEKAKREGCDVVITINSIADTTLAIQLVNSLHKDRIAVLIYDNDSYVALPLTTDHDAVLNVLRTMYPLQNSTIKGMNATIDQFKNMVTKPESAALILFHPVAIIPVSIKGTALYVITKPDDITNVVEKLSHLPKMELSSQFYTDYEDRFQYFLVVSFLFLILESLVTQRKGEWF